MQEMRNIQEEIDTTRQKMSDLGYRPVQETDLVSDQELVIVDVENFSKFYDGQLIEYTPHCILVKLDAEPIKEKSEHDKIAFYHCIRPSWSGQCFVPVEDLIFDEYMESNFHFNERRYFIKK